MGPRIERRSDFFKHFFFVFLPLRDLYSFQQQISSLTCRSSHLSDETKFMHHILSEKMNVKCCFILHLLPTVSAILSQAYKHPSCPSGKLMDGTRATRENRKKWEKLITSRGQPVFRKFPNGWSLTF